MSHVVLASGGHFVPPSPADFRLPPIFGDSALFTKPFFLLVIAGALVVWFFVSASRRAAIVPSRLQFAGELAYNFTRNSIARDIIGSHDFMRFVPYLTALFFFLLVNNYFALVPFVQFPTLSLIGFVYALGVISWLTYNIIGMRRHGFLGYWKHQTVPPGVQAGLLPLLVPLEFLSNIIVRPITLSLRLWANLFAGHLLLLLFALGGEYLLLHSDNPVGIPAGVMSLVMGLLVSALEILVLGIQAYIFTMLTAVYISGALAEEH
ncbi:MAG: F0F1 ATP synthase subunit A [Actinomycetota bacterium]|nr:F0F1 ATP synthase subunit A [Actinomycetota bacterium]